MLNWSSIRRVFGETVREIGILLIVFTPLDATFSPDAVSVDTLVRTVLGASVMIVGGIIIETMR